MKSTVTPPKYHLITFGCQMNKSDSERIDALLQNLGFVPTEVPEASDLILINTCSVRQKAEDRVFGFMHNFSKLKDQNPNLILGITGCMPGRDRDGAIRKRLPAVDLYFPTSDMTQLPRWIAEIRPELVNSDLMADDYLKLQPKYHSTKQAYVTIQTGCNKFCTYCVVPFSRGLEKNRPVRDIVDEIRHLAESGCVEVTLLGQTVNSFQASDPEHFSDENPYKDHFAALLWEINQIPGISRLHFTAPHPLHMTDEVIDAMTLPAHLNFIHLPVQSGDNEILRRMNRRHTREQFVDVMNRLTKKIPNIAIGTDIIVGFCGETEEQFERTVSLYKEINFDISYTAMYSPRSGTAAYRAFKDDVSLEEKKQRWNVIQGLMEQTVFQKNQAFKGKTVSVLVERFEPPTFTLEGAEVPGMCLGNSREMKLVRFPGMETLKGQIVDVKINEAKEWVLIGSRVL